MGERFCREADSEALDELGDAVGVHFQFEAVAELPKSLGACLGNAAEVDQLGEETFESLQTAQSIGL